VCRIVHDVYRQYEQDCGINMCVFQYVLRACVIVKRIVNAILVIV